MQLLSITALSNSMYTLHFQILVYIYIWWRFANTWRHQMDTFSALLALCAGNSPVTGEFPTQTPVTRSFDVFFDLRLNKQLSNQSWGWWFETLSCPLSRQYNDKSATTIKHVQPVLSCPAVCWIFPMQLLKGCDWTMYDQWIVICFFGWWTFNPA